MRVHGKGSGSGVQAEELNPNPNPKPKPNPNWKVDKDGQLNDDEGCPVRVGFMVTARIGVGEEGLG